MPTCVPFRKCFLTNNPLKADDVAMMITTLLGSRDMYMIK